MKGLLSKCTAVKIDFHWTIKNTVCGCVCEHFLSPEILHAGTVKGLSLMQLLGSKWTYIFTLLLLFLVVMMVNLKL